MRDRLFRGAGFEFLRTAEDVPHPWRIVLNLLNLKKERVSNPRVASLAIRHFEQWHLSETVWSRPFL
jgi:hypothetical protein